MSTTRSPRDSGAKPPYSFFFLEPTPKVIRRRHQEGAKVTTQLHKEKRKQPNGHQKRKEREKNNKQNHILHFRSCSLANSDIILTKYSIPYFFLK